MARPYSFYINPIAQNSYNNKPLVHRDVTFSSASSSFLREHEFNFGALFHSGVPYISRKEEDEAIATHFNEDDRIRNQEEVFPDDPVSIKFNAEMQRKVQAYVTKDRTALKSEILDLALPGGVKTFGYQRRLIHQFLKVNFPDYVVIGPGDTPHMAGVRRSEPGGEARRAAGRSTALKADLHKMAGFRWIFEALVGGDLSALKPEWFCAQNGTDLGNWIDTAAIQNQIDYITAKLKSKPPTIVGHNAFTDLAFMYKTFIGDLPAKLDDFKRCVNQEMFPVIFDTKYIATMLSGGCVNTRSDSSLSQMFAKYGDFKEPVIHVPQEFEAHLKKGEAHHAGYDAYMTLRTFVGLADEVLKDSKYYHSALLNTTNNNSHGQTYDIYHPRHHLELEQAQFHGNHMAQGRAPSMYQLTCVPMGMHQGRHDYDGMLYTSGLTDFQAHAIHQVKLNGANENIIPTTEDDDPWDVSMELEPQKIAQRVVDEFAHVRWNLNCGPFTLNRDTHPGGPYNLVNGQPKPSAFIPDTMDNFWKPYMNKLRAYRCDNETIDFADYSDPAIMSESPSPDVEMTGYEYQNIAIQTTPRKHGHDIGTTMTPHMDCSYAVIVRSLSEDSIPVPVTPSQKADYAAAVKRPSPITSTSVSPDASPKTKVKTVLPLSSLRPAQPEQATESMEPPKKECRSSPWGFKGRDGKPQAADSRNTNANTNAPVQDNGRGNSRANVNQNGNIVNNGQNQNCRNSSTNNHNNSDNQDRRNSSTGHGYRQRRKSKATPPPQPPFSFTAPKPQPPLNTVAPKFYPKHNHNKPATYANFNTNLSKSNNSATPQKRPARDSFKDQGGSKFHQGRPSTQPQSAGRWHGGKQAIQTIAQTSQGIPRRGYHYQQDRQGGQASFPQHGGLGAQITGYGNPPPAMPLAMKCAGNSDALMTEGENGDVSGDAEAEVDAETFGVAEMGV